MSILTTIDGIPVFDNVLEAENWAIANGLEGSSHQHLYLNQIGYMGGSSHDNALNPPSTSAPATPPATPPATNGETTY